MRTKNFVEIFFLIVSGITINLLSDLMTLDPLVVIIGAVALFAVMALYTSSSGELHKGSVGLQANSATIDVIKFSLVSLVMGAVLTWLTAKLAVRFAPSITFTPPINLGNESKHYFLPLYELIAGGIITLLAVIPAIRGRPLAELSAFLVPAIAGMTLVLSRGPVQFVFSETDVVGTFFGWLATSGLIVTLAYLRSDIFRLFSIFWFGSGQSREKQEPDSTKPVGE